jgi:hypothetical protein
VKLIDQERAGVFPEHEGLRFVGGPYDHVRLTIPAREAMERAGAKVTPEPCQDIVPTFTVSMYDRVPPGLVAAVTMVAVPGSGGGLLRQFASLRLEHEPPWPGELAADLWTLAAWTPCPKCGAPLVWYEAGYVPGYCVCAGEAHHHWLIE